MGVQIAYITVLVRDQDEALRFYTEQLGMEKREDDTSTDSRWLTVAPPGQQEVAFVLRQAEGGDLARVGDQAGTDRLCILLTDDCRQACETLRARGVEFVLPPTERPFGVIADCRDLYGNVLGLWEPR